MFVYDTKIFERELNQLQIRCMDVQLKKFLTFYELLVETNQVMNLTAITEFDDVVEKHFLDSLSLQRVYDLEKAERERRTLLDLGTGAGFPGIPIKIAFPGLQVTLVDSLNKRVQFLNRVTEALSLEGVESLHARAEELARNKLYREHFDIVVSRAVANLSTLSEYCMPFVKEGGYFISYKSAAVEDEVKQAKRAIDLLGGEIADIHRFELGEQKRSFVVIEKKKKTPKSYPRKAGTPSKEPL